LTDTNKRHEWKGTTGGGNFGQQFILKLLHRCSVRTGYFFVALVFPFYLLFNKKGRKAIYHYFRQYHRFPCLQSLWMTYKTHYRFGQIIIDKFSVLAQGKTRFDIEISGQDCFDRLLIGKQGFIIAGAHVGNFEIGGYLMHQEQKPINAVVFAGEVSQLQQIRKQQMQQSNVRMIPVLPDMSHLFLLAHALSNGEIVSMPCDRLLGSSKSVSCKLLDGRIELPIGAFQLAVMHNVEIITLFVMKEPGLKYHLFIQSLNQFLPSELSKQEKIEQMAQQFANEIEKTIKKYPEQWFNFYEIIKRKEIK